jgi:ATP-dependent helicase Lhr and Lhr-like helicase
MPTSTICDAAGILAGPVANWFQNRFPGGPTPGQWEAWPAIAARQNLLLVSPTGTGKTLAAFLAILARLWGEHEDGRLGPGLRCVYISPLRSLGYDIERNLAQPLEEIRSVAGLERSPITVGVRTGDTSAYQRRQMQREPPHLLITTPESLALLLSQPAWAETWSTVEHAIIDEVHALVPTKRGADLAVSLERLAACAASDPVRVGLSATCRPAEPVARWLVGPTRACRVVEPARGFGEPQLELEVEWLGQAGEPGRRSPIYRRLLKRLASVIDQHRTTLVFANTRALTERITHDLRRVSSVDPELVAAHHSALDARRRRAVEAALKAGAARAVVSSTSLELGVDIGTVDLAVQVGLPGGVARLLQRVGRAGHHLGAVSRGLILAGTPAELAGAAVTARAGREGRIEPLRAPEAPLDVLCQQIIGMACDRDWNDDEAFALVRRAGPMAALGRGDFEACLDFLAGQLGAGAGAFEPEPGAPPRSSSPRIWRRGGQFGLRSRRVRRWLWRNIGTICSEESVSVLAGGIAVGTLEATFAERLQVGDRFVLDGQALEFRRLDGLVVHSRVAQGDPDLPRWSSDRLGLSPALAREVAWFQEKAADRLASEGPHELRAWLAEEYGLDTEASVVLEDLFEAQERYSEVPRAGVLLVEEWPHEEGFAYAFHAPLGRSACEPLARATAARLGQRFGRDLALAVADLGWSIKLEEEGRLAPDDLPGLLEAEGFEAAALEGLERGELLARRFRHVASTALMVLRNPDGGRRRVGGLFWVSQRLYPLLKARCPEHPLLRETRREVLDDLLDISSALDWLRARPTPRLRVLRSPSPFTAAWIDPALAEHVCFEPAGDALKRLHARLVASAGNR